MASKHDVDLCTLGELYREKAKAYLQRHPHQIREMLEEVRAQRVGETREVPGERSPH